MSYSACDFVDDCEQNADLYEVPQVPEGSLEECDPDEYEGDGLRILAERVARAMSDRRVLLAALRKWDVFMRANYRPADISWWHETERALGKAEWENAKAVQS